MNPKLKQLAADLQDGDVITGLLDQDAIALLGLLSYQEILEAVESHEDAQTIFWAAAQFLAGDPEKDDLISVADGVTPLEAADDYLRKTPQEVAA